MNRNSFLAIMLAAMAAVVATAISLTKQQDVEQTVAAGGKMIPGLLETVNSAEALSIRSSAGTLTIQRGETGWSLAERNGYAVRPDRVRSVLIGLANLEKLEPKTQSPNHYAALGVEDPEGKDARSTGVEVMDGQGKRLAALIVGKPKWDVGGGARGVYVRPAGDAQSWLAKGRLDIGSEASDWLEREVIHIAPERIASVVTAHPDGETWTATKGEGKGAHLAIEGVELKDRYALDGMASVFSHLQLDDVRPADDIAMAEKFLHKAEYKTFDGLTLRTRLAPLMGEHWLWIEVEGDEALAAATKGWTYKIPAFKAARLTKRLADVRKQEGTPGHGALPSQVPGAAAGPRP